jgi:hypothetical protein
VTPFVMRAGDLRTEVEEAEAMRLNKRLKHLWRWIGLAVLCGLFVAPVAQAQESKTRVDIYGFAMLDMGYQSKQNDPAWFDVLRPTKLPSFENEYGEDGRFFSGVRQSRLGVKSFTQTEMGELKTIFEFEMFGTGVDAGQTTIRLRHAWGELGKWGFGQSWSPFMDIDVFPNSIEYWGPNGMAFFRNVQARWMPVQDEHGRIWIALERPGASGDAGVANEFIGGDLQARFPLPDLSAQFRRNISRGYVQASGIVRKMNWDDNNKTNANGDLTGDATGWGIAGTSNLKAGERALARLSVLYGEGIQNYLNDAPVDVAPQTSGTTIEGVALPILGISAFVDITWNPKWTSSIGYSMVDIDNTDLQAGTAYKKGQYGLANLLFSPVKDVMMGGEIQWGDRENKNGFTSDDLRFQFSAKYNFATSVGGGN